MPRVRKIVFSVLLALLMIPAALVICVQLPVVQTALCNAVAEKLAEKVDGQARIGRIYLSPPNYLILKDILITQNDGRDTVAHIGKFMVKVNAPSFLGDNPQIHRIVLERGELHLEKLKPLLAGLSALKPIENDPGRDTLLKERRLPYNTVTLGLLRVKDFDFSLRNFNKTPIDRDRRPVKLDWADLHLQDINLEMNSIVLTDSITCTIRNLSAKELHGFDMNTFRCDVVMNGSGIHIDGLNYNDGYSNLVAPHLDLLFDDFSAFSDFCNKVTFDATFDNTFLDFKSLRYYGVKDGLNLKLYVNGRVTGPVSHLDSERLDVYSGTRQTHLILVPHIVGLPMSKSTMASVKVLNLTTNFTDVSQIVSEVTKSRNFNRKKISRLARGERISFKGSLDGLFTDFVAYGTLKGENLGTADVDVICRADKERGYTIDGYLDADRFDLGLLLQSSAVGPLTCNGQATVYTGRNLDVQMDRLDIESVTLMGREYGDIGIAGRFVDGGLRLNAECNDDWVRFGLRTEVGKLSLDNSSLSLVIDNLEFYQDSTLYHLGDILLSAESGPEGSSIDMSSSFADLGFSSDKDFAHFVNCLSERNFSDLRAGISVIVKEAEPLLKVFVPSLFIGHGTTLTYEHSPEESGTSLLQSDLVAWGNIYLKNLTVNAVTDSLNGVDLKILSDLVKCGGVDFQSVRVGVDMISDTSASFVGLLNESQFLFGGHKWTLSSDTVRVGKNNIRIDSLVLANLGHSVVVDGVLGDGEGLSVRLKDMDLSLFESIFGSSVKLGGSFNGECSAVNFFGENSAILADVRGDSISVNRRLFGDLDLRALWNTTDRRVDVSIENRLDGKLPLSAGGSFLPASDSIDLDVVMDRLNPGLFEPFLSGLVKDMDGALSGKVNLSGPLDTLTLSGTGCRLDSIGCTLAYTNVPYRIEGPFSIDNSGIRLDGLTIFDAEGNHGRVNGGVMFNGLKNIKLNTRIVMDNLMALNTGLRDNDAFYGKAYASGFVHIGGGGGRAMLLDISARTEDKTDIHIPIGSSGKDVQSILTFIPHERVKISEFDSLLAARTTAKKKSSGGGMDVRLRVEANPLARVQLEINRSTGDILAASGDGLITITSEAGRGFDIKGDYTVQSGNYRFTLVGGVLSKEFVIEPGGTISMNGDIMESRLDMTAKYRTKASLSTLISDTSSVGPRRNVECGIGLSGKLSNPELSFNVEIPDLDPTSMSQVESALNTEEKRMKQVLSLLLSGSFVPDQNGGIANTSTVLYSNVTEMMANQFNNIFRQLEIPLDFGFNYQPSSDGRSLFDVAVSTQLFNNRVIINGNIGNRKNTTSSSSDVVGDIDVQIKLNKAGKLMLNLFSHSADQYSNYLDQAQRNGAGIVYKEEFDTFRELWRKMFWSKKHREAEAQRLKEKREGK